MKKRNIDYHVMMLPGMIILIAFYFVPMLGCCMAFQDFIPAKGILGSKWIGFENFKYMFSLPDSRRIFGYLSPLYTFLSFYHGLFLQQLSAIFLHMTDQSTS